MRGKKDDLKYKYRTNEHIRAKEVRVVSDNGSEVMPTRKALDMARREGVDLVEISPNAQPPGLPSHRLLEVPLPAETPSEGNEAEASKAGSQGDTLRTAD